MTDLRRGLVEIAPTPSRQIDPAELRARAAHVQRRRRALTLALPVVFIAALVAGAAGLNDKDAASVATRGDRDHASESTTTSTSVDATTTTEPAAPVPTTDTTLATNPPERVHEGYSSQPTGQLGEWTATSRSNGVRMLLRVTPYRANVGDVVTVHVEVQAPNHRITAVAASTGDGRRLLFPGSASCDAAPSEWTGDQQYTLREEGVFRLSAAIDVADGCTSSATTDAESVGGLVVARDASAAPGTPFDEAGVQRYGCGTTNQFGLRGAATDVMACEYDHTAPGELDLGVTGYDVDGGVIKRIAIDWGDGNDDSVSFGCATSGPDTQFFQPYGSVASRYAPHHYQATGQYTVRVQVDSGTGCGITAPDQSATATKAITVTVPSSGQ